ncbi:hypothetical protein M8J76_002099 [Diaphorina citri]|nr:hypothetical protein M8J76_002099 [Diaphorina citri]
MSVAVLATKVTTGQVPKRSRPVNYNDIVTPDYPIDPWELLGENSFGQPREVPEHEVGTPIQEFYRGATVLITGGTGFMGKALTEKLLRSCPHLRRIYLLIRPKRGKPVQERLDAIFEDRVFRRLATEVPAFRDKISAVAGDISLPGLGLSGQDRERLIDSVTVVLHGAATVRFDEQIRTAVQINILGVRSMLELAKEMKHLKSFVHVSTAYTHCPRKEIDERFYDVPYKYEEFIQNILDETDEKLEETTPKILGKWPNTYTLTKALAEEVVRNEAGGLPLAVFRPSIIINSYKEPVKAWIDNPYGPVGMMVGVLTGVLHTTLNNNDRTMDVIPIDMVVNAIISTAWHTGSSNHQSIPVYNFVSSSQKPTEWGHLASQGLHQAHKWPMLESIWYISYIPTKYRWLYSLLHFVLHVIPGFVLDTYLKATGRQPILGTIYSKLHKATETLAFFALRQWTWHDSNVQSLWGQLSPEDRSMFFFNVAELRWDDYTKAIILGLRVYLMKDDIDTLPLARRKHEK